MNKEKIKKVLDQFLPKYEIIHSEINDNEILGYSFKNAGLAVRLENGLEIFGSSANADDPLIYAAYELLERYAILTHPPDLNSNDPGFKYSLSNGVALHRTFDQAKANAFYELLERNEILKSWYFNTPVRLLSPGILKALEVSLSPHYDLSVVDFSNDRRASVIGIFAFPKNSELNLIYGFGAGINEIEASAKATKEFISRLGFLFGEKPNEEAYPMGTPDFHQDFYLRYQNISVIKEWLFGIRFPKRTIVNYQLKDVYYVNITPSGWESEFYVLKAKSMDALPLFFGQPPKQVFDFPFRYDIPHPVM